MSKSFNPTATSNKISKKNIINWQNKTVREKRITGIHKHWYGDKSREEYYNNIIKPLIEQGYTFYKMQKLNLIHISSVSASNLFKKYGHNEKLLVKQNTHNGKATTGKLKKGTVTNFKGKTYEEIYGVEKAKILREKRRNWLKQNNIRKFATKISKPQAILFSLVKKMFSHAEIEFEVKITEKKSIWLDIAIPDQKINIEYDGIYWHNINDPNISVKDVDRDEYLKQNGWRVYRIRSYKNLNEKELTIELDKLQLLI